MTALAGILSGRQAGGARRWESASDVADVRHTVEHAGWAFGHVEGWRVETRAELHDALSTALELPAYYGRNLDALDECLGDLAPQRLVLWDGWSALARAEERLFRGVVRVVDRHPDRLTLLLRGDGPDVDVAWLD